MSFAHIEQFSDFHSDFAHPLHSESVRLNDELTGLLGSGLQIRSYLTFLKTYGIWVVPLLETFL